VTDSTGCQANGVVTLVQPTALLPNGLVTNVNCYGGQSGSVQLAVTGGTGPYSYNWSNAGTVASISNLNAGNFSVTVTDANQCTVTALYTLTQPTALVVTTSATGSIGTNGTATVAASGGTSPYSYNWSSSPNQTTATATGLASGQYFVTVTDAHSCSATASATVTHLVGIEESASIMSSFSLFPNPANDKLNVVINFSGLRDIQLNIADISGKVVYFAKESANGRLNHQIKVGDFNPGVYIIEATADKETIRKRFMIIR
jgi:hypothetical protein